MSISRQKYLGAIPPPNWGVEGVGCQLPSHVGSLAERRELPSRVQGRALVRNALYIFESHRTLLSAPVCRCFEFVKQCFMSHRGKRPKFKGNWPCPNVKPPVFITAWRCESVEINWKLKSTQSNTTKKLLSKRLGKPRRHSVGVLCTVGSLCWERFLLSDWSEKTTGDG